MKYSWINHALKSLKREIQRDKPCAKTFLLKREIQRDKPCAKTFLNEKYSVINHALKCS